MSVRIGWSWVLISRRDLQGPSATPNIRKLQHNNGPGARTYEILLSNRRDLKKVIVRNVGIFV